MWSLSNSDISTKLPDSILLISCVGTGGTKEKFSAVKSSELAALLTVGIAGSWLVGVEGRKSQCHVTFIAAQHQLNTVTESSNWGIYGCVLRLWHGINMEKKLF